MQQDAGRHVLEFAEIHALMVVIQLAEHNVGPYVQFFAVSPAQSVAAAPAAAPAVHLVLKTVPLAAAQSVSVVLETVRAPVLVAACRRGGHAIVGAALGAEATAQGYVLTTAQAPAERRARLLAVAYVLGAEVHAPIIVAETAPRLALMPARLLAVESAHLHALVGATLLVKRRAMFSALLRVAHGVRILVQARALVSMDMALYLNMLVKSDLICLLLSWVFPVQAITLWPVIICRKDTSETTTNHENIHLAQYYGNF